MSQMSFGSAPQDWSNISLLSFLLMARQVLGGFFKPNQPIQFDQFSQQLENVLSDFRQNLHVLQVVHTYALDIPNNDTSAETII